MRNRLLSIELVNLDISGTTALSLSKSLMGKRSSLTSINVSCNTLGPEGCRMLSEGLKGNKVLKDLDIGANGIGLSGADYLASALKVNEALETLKLYWNKIGDKGLGSLISGLSENKSLTHLDVRWNGIGSDGMARVRSAILETKTMALKSILLFSPVDSKGHEDFKALEAAIGLGDEDMRLPRKSKIIPDLKSPRLCTSSSAYTGSPSFASRLRTSAAPQKSQAETWVRETKSDLEVKVLRAQLAEERRRTPQRERLVQELSRKEKEVKSLQRKLGAAEASKIQHLNEAAAAVEALDLHAEENASMRRRAVHAEETAKAHEATIRMLQARLEGLDKATLPSPIVPSSVLSAPPLETTGSSEAKRGQTVETSTERMKKLHKFSMDMNNILVEREGIARQRAEGLEREVEHWRIKHEREAKAAESMNAEIHQLRRLLKLATRTHVPSTVQSHRRSMTSAFDLNELMRGEAEEEKRWKRRVDQLNLENHMLKIKLKMTAAPSDEAQPRHHRKASSLTGRSGKAEMKQENSRLRKELKELQSRNRQMAKVMRYLQAAGGGMAKTSPMRHQQGVHARYSSGER
eukprot:CAMPEP_0167782592 /NCGR_PEP_ID=MMETSP0111_2-20121227/6604_1 /TAXON_ID=91324 /ORGANISM="Lotharella globosa, Strain CCCM811" /LENGTH=578 /DNA_ID=CAMNT_0007673443 /DNA_START=340 /DNA_END=2076 /DNA_ORIENTATION=-